MTDKTILKIAEETTSLLKRVLPGENASSVLPSYNAILAAAKENHPDDTFLDALKSLERSDSAVDMAIAFSQLRIAVEAIIEESIE
jgi:hypothetical protein